MSENLPTPGVSTLHPLDAADPGLSAPSAWLVRFAALIAPGARVLDYACGSGRHARWLAARECRSTRSIATVPRSIDCRA